MYGNLNLDYCIKWINVFIKLGVYIIKLIEY